MLCSFGPDDAEKNINDSRDLRPCVLTHLAHRAPSPWGVARDQRQDRQHLKKELGVPYILYT